MIRLATPTAVSDRPTLAECSMTGLPRFLSALLLGASALALIPTSGSAAGTGCPDVTPQRRNAPPTEVVQEFRLGRKMHTAWRVNWAIDEGLYITSAEFRPGPGKPWVKVVGQLRLVEIFVPYETGDPRFYDISQFNWPMIPLSLNDVGFCGEVIETYVAKEVRDMGILWKDDEQALRGQALVLWAAMDAANYNYIMEFVFRDDGRLEFSVGATARNLPGREYRAHTHDGLWRIDMDLGGPANDRVMVSRRLGNMVDPAVQNVLDPFNGGVEGGIDFVPEEYTVLRIEDTRKTNKRGNPIAYDLIPMRRGSSRHQEPWSHHDFWVTPYNVDEQIYPDLPDYISNGESIDDTDVVVWHVTPIHHLPRDEDGEYDQDGTWKGSALMMKTGAMLKPRDLFDRTPFFDYKR